MEDIFKFFSTNSTGIITLLISVGLLIGILQWILWLFKLGRYEFDGDKPKNGGVIYIATDFFVKIINDFRHLLALIVILVFAFVLIFSVYHAIQIDKSSDLSNFENLKNVLQAVISTLGGIVASIIGYYFGESVGKAKGEKENVNSFAGEIDQNEEVKPVDIKIDDIDE